MVDHDLSRLQSKCIIVKEKKEMEIKTVTLYFLLLVGILKAVDM